jgi:hypothetical protein
LKYKALLNELVQIEDQYQKRIEAGEVDDIEENFYMVTVGFMTNERYFVAEDESLPDNYEHLPSEFKHLTDRVVVQKKKASESNDESDK